ncbi:hypothetical protein EVAR_95091_1 [Eumeta japonica]|uniref:Uncharacterized protein n=1 Tax=Eumeta variegata TaxID=151549 RepID=A0A4C1W801_EUMVA|nr:hypothetical protein EVAR_95091_1 [Eumeta japonica]
MDRDRTKTVVKRPGKVLSSAGGCERADESLEIGADGELSITAISLKSAAAHDFFLYVAENVQIRANLKAFRRGFRNPKLHEARQSGANDNGKLVNGRAPISKPRDKRSHPPGSRSCSGGGLKGCPGGPTSPPPPS